MRKITGEELTERERAEIEAARPKNQCYLYDEYNQCCMLDRIDKVRTTVWEGENYESSIKAE